MYQTSAIIVWMLMVSATSRGSVMEIETSLLLAVAGLLIGMLFGVVVQRSRFCMTAVVTHWILIKDPRQMHAYMTALVVAIIGTGLLEYTGLVPVSASVYRNVEINWLSMMVGGVIFGVGAVFAGGCIGRMLSLTGEGNLGALLALLMMALGATVTYTGALEPARDWIHKIAVFEVSSADASLLSVTGMPPWVLFAFLGVLFMLFLLRRRHQINHRMILSGSIIGLLVIAGWLVTGYLLVDDFNTQSPRSLSFAGPLARSALYLTIGNELYSLFGIMLVAGVVLGSFLSAISTGSFCLSPPASTEFFRILVGGLMMGSGAMLAQGCNIGQGLSGLSTLSVESVLAVTFIFLGMYAGVKWLQYVEMHGSPWGFFHLHHHIPRSVTG